MLEQIGIPHENYAAIIGGGAESSVWRQIVADTLGLELHCRQYSDSSFGSAMLAGIAAGAFIGLEDAQKRCNRTISVTKPMKKTLPFMPGCIAAIAGFMMPLRNM